MKHKELDILTLKSLFRIYCRFHHNTEEEGLCSLCGSELEYAVYKTKLCPHKEKGKTCSECGVHCFEESHREKIKEVMRYAGPRLIWKHPILSIRYIYLKIRSRQNITD